MIFSEDLAVDLTIETIFTSLGGPYIPCSEITHYIYTHMEQCRVPKKVHVVDRWMQGCRVG